MGGERHGAGGRSRRGLPRGRQCGERERHEERAAEEADAVAGRGRDCRQDVRRRQAAAEAADAPEDARRREEPAAEPRGDAAADDVEPGRHQRAADGGQQEQHEEHEGLGEGRRPSREKEGDERQPEQREALPDRVAEDERELPRQRLRVARHEERGQEPPGRHDGGDRADDHVRGAERGDERRQDGGLRPERQTDQKEPEVSAERQEVPAEVRHLERVVVAGRRRRQAESAERHTLGPRPVR